MTNHELAERFLPTLEEKGIAVSTEKVARIIGLVKERVHFEKELWEQSSFFFEAPTTYDEKTARKRWKEDTAGHMQQLIEVYESMDNFSANHQETIVKKWINDNGLNMGGIMNALRLAIVGEPKGPGMFLITELIGKKETVRRIQGAIDTLSRPANK